jgi:hypothetical protein
MGVVRTRVDPWASTTSAILLSSVPDTRPTLGAAPTMYRPSFWRNTPTWSTGVSGASGASRSMSLRSRYSVSSTSRNFSMPQSAIRNLSRARERSRRYP